MKIRITQKPAYRVSPKSGAELTEEEKEIIVGSLLGDLSVQRGTPKSNCRLHFKLSLKHKEYIDHLYGIFADITGTGPKE